MTLPEYLRRVSILALLLVALAVPGQETEAPAVGTTPVGTTPLSVPDIVITGEDAIIIVPPLPVLPGGSIPVPQVELQPIPFRPSPTACDPVTAGAPLSREAFVIEPLCLELSVLTDWLPFFLMLGEDPKAPIPAMQALGIRHVVVTDRDNISAQNNGRDE